MEEAALAADEEGSEGFAFPHIGGTQVAFSAYDSAGESLVQQRDGKLVTVVSSSQPNSASRFTSVQSPASTDEAVAFVGSTTTAEGIFLTAYPFKSYEQIAAVGASSAAKSQNTFGAVKSPSLERHNVAFAGTRGGLAGIYAARSPTSDGDGSRQVHTLVNASRTPPQHPHAPLRCLMNPSISRAGYVAFFGSDCTGGDAGGRPLDPQRMFRTKAAHEHAVHLGDAAGVVVAGIYLAHLPAAGGAWPAAGAADITVVADSSTLVPGSPTDTFVAFSAPVASESMVAFVASTSAGTIGVYTYDLGAPTSLRKVADSETAVPGGAGTFSDFPYAPSVAGTTVVFYGSAGGAASGLYAHTRASAGGEELTKLVTMADTIGGQSIAFLGAGAASSDATSAAFYAVTDTNGVYTVAIG